MSEGVNVFVEMGADTPLGSMMKEVILKKGYQGKNMYVLFEHNLSI